MNIENSLLRITCIVNPLIVIETLTRCGLPNKRQHLLYPSCYLYSKNDIEYRRFSEAWIHNVICSSIAEHAIRFILG